MTDNHINMNLVKELKHVMGEDFPLLINTYLTDAELRLHDLQQAFDERQAKDVRRSAHSLKGSSANLGAVELVELLRKIEEYSREEKLEEAESLFVDVQREYHHIKMVMNQWHSS